MTAAERLAALGLVRASTGGGCEGAESETVAGLRVFATDGEAGFPVDEAGGLWVGVLSEEHDEPLWEAEGVEWDRLVAEAFAARAAFIGRGVRS